MQREVRLRNYSQTVVSAIRSFTKLTSHDVGSRAVWVVSHALAQRVIDAGPEAWPGRQRSST